MTLKGHNALRNGMFQAKSGHSSETLKDMAGYCMLIANRKWHRPTSFQMK